MNLEDVLLTFRAAADPDACSKHSGNEKLDLSDSLLGHGKTNPYCQSVNSYRMHRAGKAVIGRVPQGRLSGGHGF